MKYAKPWVRSGQLAPIMSLQTGKYHRGVVNGLLNIILRSEKVPAACRKKLTREINKATQGLQLHLINTTEKLRYEKYTRDDSEIWIHAKMAVMFSLWLLGKNYRDHKELHFVFVDLGEFTNKSCGTTSAR